MARNKKFDAPVTEQQTVPAEAIVDGNAEVATPTPEPTAPAAEAKPKAPRVVVRPTIKGEGSDDEPKKCEVYAMPTRAQRFEVFINGLLTNVCNTAFAKKDGTVSQYGYFPWESSSFYVKDFQFVEGASYVLDVPTDYEFRIPTSRESEYEKMKARKAAKAAAETTPVEATVTAETPSEMPTTEEVVAG
jgi:hypothetical protein